MDAVYFGGKYYEEAIINSEGETIQLSKVIRQGAGFGLLAESGTARRVNYRPAAHRKYPGPDELREEAAGEKQP
jgi:hypothetical protein